MDPNATLGRLLADARGLVEAEDDAIDPQDVRRMADLALALDEWIRRGGFLPDAWDAGTCGRGAE